MTRVWDHYEFKVAEHYVYPMTYGESDDSAELAEWQSFADGAEAQARARGFTVGHWVDVDGSGEDWGVCAVCGLFAMRCTVRLMVFRDSEVHA